MLVIRRRVGESLLISDDIEIEILALTQSHVKLGIRAPRTVLILRKEVQLTHDQNQQASKMPSLDTLSDLAKILRDTSNPSSRNSSPAR